MSGDLQSVASALRERVSDFPGPTCPEIDRLQREIDPVRAKADRLGRAALDEDDLDDLRDFIKDVDQLLWGMPTALEDLRRKNDELRSALHEALDSRKEAADWLDEIDSQEEAA